MKSALGCNIVAWDKQQSGRDLIVDTTPVVKRATSWKWVALSILGVVFLMSGALATVFWQHRPVAQQLEGDVRTVAGEINLQGTPLREIHIPFSNGDIKVSTSDGRWLSWHCTVKGEHHSPLHSLENHVLTLALNEYDGVECSITLPEKVRTKVKGHNGRVALVRPRADLEVDLMNGTVSVTPDQTQHYKYDISVMNGRIDRFESSAALNAHRLNISVMNGTIGRATAGL